MLSKKARVSILRSTCLFVLAILLVSMSAYAQKGTIRGTVKDPAGNNLVGATVVVYDTAGNKLHTTLTGEKGDFSVSVNTARSSYLIVSYSQSASRTIFLNPTTGVYDLGPIRLEPLQYSLTEVVVQGKRSPVNFKVDKQVYRAAQFNSAANGNAVDVLKNLPSVSVNGQGEISMRGAGSFQVMINGRPAVGDPALILSQLSASSIENIEVITTPGASYDADGKSGIINIVTKNAVEGGWMLQSSAMYGAPPVKNFDNKRNSDPQRYSIDITAAYRKNRWDISTGLNWLRNDMAGYREGDVYTEINGMRTHFPSSGERSFKRYNYGGRIAVGYQTSAGNRWDAGFYMGKRYQNRVADLTYINTHTNLATNATTAFSYYNENTQEKQGVFTLANLGYDQKLSSTARLAVSAQYEGAALDGLTTNLNLAYKGSGTIYQETRNPSTNPLQAFRLRTDLTQKTRNGTLQAGYQFRRDSQSGDFTYYYKDLGSNVFLVDPQFTSSVKVTNLIHAGYVQHSAKRGRLFHQEGLRLEHQTRELLFSLANDQRRMVLTSLFPSFLLRYDMEKRTLLKAAYSRRVKRTNNYELNPFPEREHSETLEQGDPDLLPELMCTWELGIEKNWPKAMFFATLYFQDIRNPIQRVNKVFNDTILNRVFTNAEKATQVGLEMNLTATVAKSWQMVLGGNIYRYDIRGKLFGGTIPVSNASWVYSINSTQTFTLSPRMVLQFTVNYLSQRATAQGEDGKFLTPHLSLKRTSSNQRWSYQLQWLNIDMGMYQSNRQRITTRGSNFYSTTNYIYEPDQLQFSVNFNLTRKNRKISLPASEMAEKEF